MAPVFFKVCATMDISNFDFELPEKLIAQHPPEVRGSSRLLVALPTLPIEDKHFGDYPIMSHRAMCWC